MSVGDIGEWRPASELLEGGSGGVLVTKIDGAGILGLFGVIDFEVFHHLQDFVEAGIGCNLGN